MPEPRPYPGMPRWVKLSGIVAVILVLLVVVVVVTGIGGPHGPFRHLQPASTATPEVQAQTEAPPEGAGNE